MYVFCTVAAVYAVAKCMYTVGSCVIFCCEMYVYSTVAAVYAFEKLMYTVL